MLDFESFCYLQNQKTGSTFVEKFLRKFSNQPFRRFEKHAAVNFAEYNSAKFYFINVREPLDLYWSLFNYGLDGNGEVCARLSDSGYGHLYRRGAAGFNEWLSFIQKPEHSRILHPRFTEAVARQFGFMTWRFLRLASCGFEDMAPFLSEADRAKAAERLIVNKVLRTETLKDDLCELVSGDLSPYIGELEPAVRWIREAQHINASSVRSKDEIQPFATAMIKSREAYLYEKFYPNA